jgi:hypothetical protein
VEPGPLITDPLTRDGAEDPDGILGAVLHASGGPTPVQLATGGATLVTTLGDARTVLTNADDFELPFDVSRQRFRRAERPRKATPPLSPGAVAVGRQIFVSELAATEPSFAGHGLDTLAFLRDPVARSTTAALVPEADIATRNQIAALVLAWIDALAPVISAARAPRRCSRVRRTEQRAHRTLIRSLANLGVHDPAGRAATLAAGVQVPIAAGAWCLTQLACRPDLRRRLHDDPDVALPYVWEILRLYPPTWVLPRVSTREYVLGGRPIPAYTPILVSPLALGRLPDLVPGPASGGSPLEELDPERWSQAEHRPGAWLPFGAGPHACPGRNLGLAQLTHLVSWSSAFELTSAGEPAVDTSRGLSPAPSRIDVQRQPRGR